MEGSHDWFHVERVLKISLHIHKQEGGDKEIIQLAALLHDISDHKYNGGDFEKGAQESYKIIKDHGGHEKVALKVSAIISQISYKGASVMDESISLEGRIVRDADRLDAIGAIGIARAFAYGGSKGRPLFDPKIKPVNHSSKEAYLNSKTHTINHFYEKLLLLKDRLHTDTAKQIARERQQIMIRFLDSFYTEWDVDFKS